MRGKNRLWRISAAEFQREYSSYPDSIGGTTFLCREGHISAMSSSPAKDPVIFGQEFTILKKLLYSTTYCGFGGPAGCSHEFFTKFAVMNFNCLQ